MARRQVGIKLDEGLLARVNAAAGMLGQTRTVFVERALEKALGGDPGGRSGERQETVRPVQEAGSTPARSASSRASKEERIAVAREAAPVAPASGWSRGPREPNLAALERMRRLGS